MGHSQVVFDKMKESFLDVDVSGEPTSTNLNNKHLKDGKQTNRESTSGRYRAIDKAEIPHIKSSDMEERI